VRLFGFGDLRVIFFLAEISEIASSEPLSKTGELLPLTRHLTLLPHFGGDAAFDMHIGKLRCPA